MSLTQRRNFAHLFPHYQKASNKILRVRLRNHPPPLPPSPLPLSLLPLYFGYKISLQNKQEKILHYIYFLYCLVSWKINSRKKELICSTCDGNYIYLYIHLPSKVIRKNNRKKTFFSTCLGQKSQNVP